ncbi:hypothetical protein NDU88_004770 [Pleurodeles waltl]|uniref:Uncharacterized protein n=1 Tax=Pleurodeles waltl TaxID=8319 RepID=A0AAV7WTD6_PLEWA|nr:hypothetical protein NDU88_004770 [Pleurodeles waltl]
MVSLTWTGGAAAWPQGVGGTLAGRQQRPGRLQPAPTWALTQLAGSVAAGVTQLVGLGPQGDQRQATGPTLEGVPQTWARRRAVGHVGHDRARLLAPNCLGPVSLGRLGTWLQGSKVGRQCMSDSALVKTAQAWSDAVLRDLWT